SARCAASSRSPPAPAKTAPRRAPSTCAVSTTSTCKPYRPNTSTARAASGKRCQRLTTTQVPLAATLSAPDDDASAASVKHVGDALTQAQACARQRPDLLAAL